MSDKEMKKLAESDLSYNQLYDCTRRAVISFFARDYAEKIGYSADKFEFVMLFVKKSYQALWKQLEDTQKGNL